jgi:hypothetical protein
MVCIKNGSITSIMDIRKLAIMHKGGIPLYSLHNGERYQHFDFYHGETYTFIKHAEYQFPAHYVLRNKNQVVYQYKVSIPDSSGHQVIFVEETTIVIVLKFP